MVIRRIKYFLTKNPLDLIDPGAAVDEKIRLESEIEQLHKKIAALEKQIDEYWNKARETKSPADERALAERINTISVRKKSTLAKISAKESRLRTVEEFINKIEEKKQKSSLAPLTKGSEQELQDFLDQISVFEEGKKQRERIMAGSTEPDSDEIDENVNDILQAIKSTKATDTIAPEKEQVFPKEKKPEFES
ncbi:hypothetical protein [uncultured Methanoregula sp.]|uniref:hypothetical protein n=1 Tax=uncultured Methanoregula sp. TaxID=1005933 RepID=UPI002AAB8FAC|nr:hypothetical protein [uncultured Methanoregula sp.]